MSHVSGKFAKFQNWNPSILVEAIKNELPSVSTYINQLAQLSDEELNKIQLTDKLDDLLHNLNQFETWCQIIQITNNDDEFITNGNEEVLGINFLEKNNWSTVRHEARHANTLANQLTGSLNKIRAGLEDHQDQRGVPEDIALINQTIKDTVSGLASDWITNPE
jgi:hypothetical protein